MLGSYRGSVKKILGPTMSNLIERTLSQRKNDVKKTQLLSLSLLSLLGSSRSCLSCQYYPCSSFPSAILFSSFPLIYLFSFFFCVVPPLALALSPLAPLHSKINPSLVFSCLSAYARGCSQTSAALRKMLFHREMQNITNYSNGETSTRFLSCSMSFSEAHMLNRASSPFWPLQLQHWLMLNETRESNTKAWILRWIGWG